VRDPQRTSALALPPQRSTHVLRRLARERNWKEVQWIVLTALALVAIVLGSIGYREHYEANNVAATRPWDIAFRDIQLFLFSVDTLNRPLPVTLEIARWLAPAVAAYSALFALYNIFRTRIRQMRLPFVQQHVVVCGAGDKGLIFTRALRANGTRVVVIERDANSENLALCDNAGAVVLVGDARDNDLLVQAGVPRAAYLVVVCNDDAVNTEIALRARELATRRPDALPPLQGVVHLLDADRAALLRARELTHAGESRFRLDFFNVVAAGAEEMLDAFPPSGPSPHVLVVGAGPFAEWLVVGTAQRWARTDTDGARPQLTIVDEAAEAHLEMLRNTHPELQYVCDVTSVPVRVSHVDAVMKALPASRPVTHAYICRGDDGSNLSAALTLRNHVLPTQAPITVAMSRVNGLAQLLEADASKVTGLGQIDAFPVLERTCDPELLLSHTFEVYARAAHEDYCDREQAKGDPRNPSLQPFDQLPFDAQQQNRSQAADVGRKLALIGCSIVPRRDFTAPDFTFTDVELERLSELEHERYVALAIGQGWRYAPDDKDRRARTNPTLVSWADLPEDEREKDRAAIRAIPRILARLGLQVARVDVPAPPP
jgi:voltage-gated potassium channel Kch